MKRKGWIVGVVVTGGVVLAMRGCLSKPEAPDVRLAGRLAAMCEIARGNIATPERGLRKLGGYLGKHLGDITGELGDTIATIEKIADDDKHDERARVARDRIRKPVHSCEDDWNRFGEAVDKDPAATELLVETNERLGRTLQILIGERVNLRDLPAYLISNFQVVPSSNRPVPPPGAS